MAISLSITGAECVCVSKYVARFHLISPPPPSFFLFLPLNLPVGSTESLNCHSAFISIYFFFEKLCGKRIREARLCQALFRAEKKLIFNVPIQRLM